MPEATQTLKAPVLKSMTDKGDGTYTAKFMTEEVQGKITVYAYTEQGRNPDTNLYKSADWSGTPIKLENFEFMDIITSDLYESGIAQGPFSITQE